MSGIWSPLIVLILLAPQTVPPTPPSKAPEPQPTSQPAEGRASTFTPPAQADIYRDLIRRQEAPKPLMPTTPGKPDQPAVATEKGPEVLPEGTRLIRRPGRLVIMSDRANFVFQPDDRFPIQQTMTILESQLLERMEQEAELGATEFVISAEVTRYRGKNYLLLLQVTRQIRNNNLAP